jgi:DNA-binding transcriptional ArsR family regulator
MTRAPGGADPDVFRAISEETRREILVLLSRGERSVNELAARFPVTRPAISQHLKVLREAGLVTDRKEGRTRLYRLEPAPLGEVIDWLTFFDAFWDDRLASLARYLRGGRTE